MTSVSRHIFLKRLGDSHIFTVTFYLQVSDDAEVLRLLEAAGGGGGEFVRPADQQVTCGGVTAALRANICKLRLQSRDGAPQGCRGIHRNQPTSQKNRQVLRLLFRMKPGSKQIVLVIKFYFVQPDFTSPSGRGSILGKHWVIGCIWVSLQVLFLESDHPSAGRRWWYSGSFKKRITHLKLSKGGWWATCRSAQHWQLESSSRECV